MNKQFFINILLLIFSFSALAVPNIRRNNVKKRTPIAKHVKKETASKAQTDDFTYDDQEEKPTIGESWSKLIRLKWASLSKDDIWNISASVVTCGVIAYLYNHAPQIPANNSNKPGPDNAHKNHVHKPKPTNTNNNPLNDKEKECELCGEDKKGHEFYTLSCCDYNATCSACLIEMVNIALKEKTTAELKCPNRNCQKPISEQDTRNITNTQQDMKDTLDDVKINEYLDLQGDDTKRCPTPDCLFAFINDEHIQAEITCPECKKTYCTNCRVQHSMKMTCKQAEEDLKITGNKNKSEKATQEWLEKNTKACPICKTRVEKNGGCLTLRCNRCNHQFCWKCLKPHDHTENHACGLWGNEADKNQAQRELIEALAGQGQQGQFNWNNGNNQAGNINNPLFNGFDFINIFNIFNGQQPNPPVQNINNNRPNNPVQNNIGNQNNIRNNVVGNANANPNANRGRVNNANNNRPVANANANRRVAAPKKR